MSGFFVLKSAALPDQVATGRAIMKVSQSVFTTSPGSEWQKFNADTRGWLHRNGYIYTGPDAGPNGEIPPTIDIVPVYDTPTKMHVRVPWAGDLENPPLVQDEASYGMGPNRFPVLLARYFMRKCR